MRISQSRLKRAGHFGTGLLIGFSAVTPAVAASVEQAQEWSDYVMIGSLVLLLIGVLARAFTSSSAPLPRNSNSPPAEPASAYSIDAHRITGFTR